MAAPPVIHPLGTARLACGCDVAFRPGLEGSPVTVVVIGKSEGCGMNLHVAGMAVYDHREAMRASTRHPLHVQPDYEEEG